LPARGGKEGGKRGESRFYGLERGLSSYLTSEGKEGKKLSKPKHDPEGGRGSTFSFLFPGRSKKGREEKNRGGVSRAQKRRWNQNVLHLTVLHVGHEGERGVEKGREERKKKEEEEQIEIDVSQEQSGREEMAETHK